MKHVEILNLIKQKIESLPKWKKKPIRIAINGIEGTGKTVFAKIITEYLNENKVNAIQISIDGFHFNKEHRYKQGRDSAKGYYEDCYNELVFVEKVLKSSQKEAPEYTKAIHNLETDKYLNLEPTKIENETVLITDGAYLFKKNYVGHWDLKIFLKTDFGTALTRGINRDKARLGGLKATKDKYDNRYHKASKIYIEECKPEEIADIIIDNTDFENLVFIKK